MKGFMFELTDRSETARCLLELDTPAPVGAVDECGQSPIISMIAKMPGVVSNRDLLNFKP